MRYIEQFTFCDDPRGVYPYRVLAPKLGGTVELSDITIFYGSNGSGKSTALNAMARRVGMPNMTPGNSNEYFKGYVKQCSFSLAEEIPPMSRFVRSEDIMDGINRIRKEVRRINSTVMNTVTDMDEMGDPQMMKKLFDPDTLTNDERFFLSRLSSARECFEQIFQTPDQFSNGETAIDFFNNELLADAVYFLDEPENSLAPDLQLELAHRLELLSHYLNCQIIIATHSPFLLSMRDAKVINMDTVPASVSRWYELPNMQVYYDFFRRYRKHFEKEGK